MSNYSDSQFNPEDHNTSWYKVLDLIKTKSKVLDIGCSSGNFGEVLIEQKQCTVDGVELDYEDYNMAKKKLRNVYNLNIEKDDISIISEKYDYLYFGDVIEHLITPVQTLVKVKSLLKQDGSVVFSIPNMAFIAIRLELLMGEFEYTETGLLDKTHLHFYTLKEIERIFKESGLTINKIDFVESGYTTDVVKTYLDRAGLRGTEKFYKFCKTPEASAFQFVGLASFSSKQKPSKLKKFSPFNKQDEYYRDKLATLNKTIKNQHEQIDNLIQENLVLKNNINEIVNSRKYKLINKISRIKRS